MSTPFNPTPAPNPSPAEIEAALTPLEEQEERDYEEMLCRLYEGRKAYEDSIDQHPADRRFWL